MNSKHSNIESGRLQQALERAAQRERSTRRQSEPLQPLRISPMKIDYSIDQCIEHKVLAPDNPQTHPASAAAYRVLRTRFLHRARSNNWTTVGISSPGQGDGKSVSAINLALSVARAGNHNVFLMDLDLRRPKTWQYLGASPPREITDYLTGDAAAEDVLFSIGIENLTIAGAVTGTGEASELLAGPRILELFSFIKSNASNAMILIDLPPLLSTDDALIMAARVDACLLVVSEGRSRRDAAAKALELLEDFNLAGIVLNRSKTMVTDYYTAY
jgi:protein-tyrosine kinase